MSNKDTFNYRVQVEGAGDFYIDEQWLMVLTPLLRAAQAASHGPDSAFWDADVMSVPVRLVGCGSRLIAIIKEIRSLTGKSLKDSKAMLDRVLAPNPEPGGVLLGVYPYDRALEIKRAFEEATGRVSVPSPLEMLGNVGVAGD